MSPFLPVLTTRCSHCWVGSGKGDPTISCLHWATSECERITTASPMGQQLQSVSGLEALVESPVCSRPGEASSPNFESHSDLAVQREKPVLL